MKKRQGLVFQVILVAAIAVRLLGFGTVLVGINQDEAHKRKRRKAEDTINLGKLQGTLQRP